MNRSFKVNLLAVGALLLLMHALYFVNRDFFLEDRLVENAQVMFLVLASASAFLRSRQADWMKYQWLYRLLAVAAFVLVLEELSFGQRILGFATPEFMAARNTQREFNFHNLWFGLVDRLVMGTIGVVSLAVVLLRKARVAIPLEPRYLPAASNATYLMLVAIAVYYYASGILIFAVHLFPEERSYMELHEALLYWVLLLLVNTRPDEL